ncbi:hypothetical protein, partial [Chromatium okenii]
MNTKITKSLPILSILAVVMLTTPGCLMTITEPAFPVTYSQPVAVDYRPLFYNGYTVYFADSGIPYYLYGGVRHWVPHHARARYIEHWRHHKSDYRNWYRRNNNHF